MADSMHCVMYLVGVDVRRVAEICAFDEISRNWQGSKHQATLDRCRTGRRYGDMSGRRMRSISHQLMFVAYSIQVYGRIGVSPTLCPSAPTRSCSKCQENVVYTTSFTTSPWRLIQPSCLHCATHVSSQRTSLRHSDPVMAYASLCIVKTWRIHLLVPWT